MPHNLLTLILLPALMTLWVTAAAADQELRLRLLGAIPVFDGGEDLREPSGLALDPATNRLWTVSDDTGRAFRLKDTGEVSSDHSPLVDADDLEGIAVLPDGTLAIVREGSNEILIVDEGNGVVLRRKQLSMMDGFDAVREDFEAGSGNKGLEGITVEPATGKLYVIKEGRPRLLLEISSDLASITMVHRLTASAGFAVDGLSDRELDVSGIAYDAGRERFWIVSDEGQRVFLYDPAARRAIDTALRIHSEDAVQKLKNAEGVTLSRDGNILFVVTDDREGSVLAAYEILEPRP